MKQSPIPSPALAHLDGRLADLSMRGLLRARPEPHIPGRVSFCSNDYLGLADRSVAGVRAGAGASRLVAGEQGEHVRLEAALADWLGLDACLLFTSGYAANVGLMPALADSGDDLILSDALNHASIVDGCRLARGETRVFPHLDVEAVERQLGACGGRRAWVVTESYFSMDADSPDLGRLRQVCDAHGAALIVDEAHALGVLGPDGRGLLARAGVRADVLVGTLGKAFGGGGAFVAGCRALVDWLWNRARSFVFSTGLSPALADAGLRALELIRGDASPRERALDCAVQLRDGMRGLGHLPLGYGHIIPWVVGESSRAVRYAAALRSLGFDVQAIRPPSVPAGTARLRLTASAHQSSADVDALVARLSELPRLPLDRG